MSQYQDQLSSVQSNLQRKDQEHQQSIQKLQDQVWVLELSLVGQANLPSMATSSSKAGLHQEVCLFVYLFTYTQEYTYTTITLLSMHIMCKNTNLDQSLLCL